MAPKKDVIDIVTELGGIKTPQAADQVLHDRVEAAQLAKLNKIKNARFCQNNLCDNMKLNSYDLIIANLPYISEYEYKKLNPEIRNFEPACALLAKNNGMELINKLI